MDDNNIDYNIYIRNIFNDVRTPLSIIYLNINLLYDLCSCNKSKELITLIEYCITYIDTILEKIIIFNNNKILLERFKSFDIKRLINGVNYISNYLINNSNNNCKIEYKINKNIFKMYYGDQISLKHVLIILLKNAIDYSSQYQDNIIKFTIDKKASSETDELLLISIIDNNKMNSESKARLFEKYKQRLGLFIAKNIIELHNGKIYYDNQVVSFEDNPDTRVETQNKFTIEILLKKSISLQNDNVIRSVDRHNSIRQRNTYTDIFEKINDKLDKSNSLELFQNIDSNTDFIKYTNIKRGLSSHISRTVTPNISRGVSPNILNEIAQHISMDVSPNISSEDMLDQLDTSKNNNIKLEILPMTSIVSIKESNIKSTFQNMITSTINNIITPIKPSTECPSDKNNIRKSFIKPESRNVSNKIKNILVIDDSLINRKMMTTILKKRCDNFKITTAVDGLDALNKVCNNMNLYDLLLIDNTMPNLTGEMTTKLLRGINYNKLIIGITGNNKEEDIDNFNMSGVDYIFIKPFNLEKLNLLFDFLDNNGYYRIGNQKISITSNNKLVWVPANN